MYQLKLDKFEGPFDLLLQLIEKEELDITQISLAKITDTFLGYLEEIEETKPDELADFLVIAAKLLLIKSSLLLPGSVGVDEETADLIDQLKIYREYLTASKTIHKIISHKNFTYGREKLILGEGPRIFRLTTKITPAILEKSLENVLNIVLSQIKLAQRSLRKIISLKGKITELIDLIKKFTEVKLNSLLNNSAKEEVVVTFLAVLELVRGKSITVNQDGLFEDITIKKLEQ